MISSKRVYKVFGITPGPWERILTLKKEFAVRAEQGLLFTFWKPNRWPNQFERFEKETNESFSNAKVVSSSPEMLVALVNVLVDYQTNLSSCYTKEEMYLSWVKVIESADSQGREWSELLKELED